jgi:predicted transposase/invertase (TIGR01784 family)
MFERYACSLIIFYSIIIGMERLNPLNDYLFLKLMGEAGDEEQCLAFLNAVLGSKNKKSVKLIKILENKTFTADVIGEKSSILDVRAETDVGEKVNIEVQLKDFHNMEKRTLLHWGREFTKGISAGDDYKDLPKVITINIVNFDHVKLDDFHTCFHLWEDYHHDYLLTDVLEIHFLNMVKFRKLKSKDIVNRPLERWLAFFDITTPEEILQEVIQMDSTINKTNELLNFVMQDKEALRAYHMREMAMSDWTTGVNTAIEKKQIEIATNLKRMGLPVAQIAEGTGLDIETIQSLP